MFKALIIEDELIAAQQLQRLLAESAEDVQVVDVLQSVEEAVEFFSEKADKADFVFMDIHLADGLAFHIFDSVKVSIPIIFTTAYDQYALDAFKVNSIDYLLKPIGKEDLGRALNKLKLFGGIQGGGIDEDKIASMMEMIRAQSRKYKSYFLIPVRERLVPLDVNQIAFFHVVEKTTHAVTFDGKSFAMDKPLDSIFSQLDPSRFFRANRQYVVSHRAVKDISVWPLGKLHITLTLPTPEKIIVSRNRNCEFKEWYTMSL